MQTDLYSHVQWAFLKNNNSSATDIGAELKNTALGRLGLEFGDASARWMN